MPLQDPPSSSIPPSLGPGARPTAENQQKRSIDALLQDTPNIRSTYNVRLQESGVFLSYDLKGSTRSYSLSFDRLPLTGFKRWIVYGGPKRGYVSGVKAIDALVGMEVFTGKHLTETEAEGIVYHTAKRSVYNFYGVATGVSTACAIGYRTSANMKFPFRSPKPLNAYNAFPTRSMPLLTGPLAQSMWQVARYSTWSMVCVFIIRPIFNAVANYQMVNGIYEDDRTKHLKPLLKAGLNSATPRLRKSASGAPPGGKQESDHAQSEDQNSYEYGQASYQGFSADQEPTPESFDRNSTFESNQDSGRQSNRGGEQYGTQWGGSGTGTGPSYKRPPAPRASAPSSGGDIFFDDDASPTAGNDPDMSTPSRDGTSYGPGAWDRIRRGGRSQLSTASSETPSQSQGWNSSRSSREDRYGEPMPSSSEGGSFSKSDADKSYARSQAQKEFDDVLERERRSSGSGEYDRGMRALEAGQESAGLEGTSAWEQRRRR
ncbi:hypothetical protein B0A52_02126 [Exophiala mesophila]|uniref:Uncharacterized protein n=1 Tax=Exophiala mesophila TaxID=212818 RepID=A0A438NF21_EXOME|nr:hypothetical protein B0A52_02126 [Exophiala mesophila]